MKIMEIKKLINRQTVNWTQSEKKNLNWKLVLRSLHKTFPKEIKGKNN